MGKRQPMPLSMDADMVRNHIRESMECLEFTQKDYADMAGVSESYLSDVLNGRREPGGKLLDQLGIERVVYYEYKKD